MTVYQCQNCYFVFDSSTAQCPHCESKRVEADEELKEEEMDGDNDDFIEVIGN